MKRLSRLTCTLALLLFPLIGAHDPAAVQAAPAAARKPVKILVAYYSRTGSTEEMARAVVEGVCRVPEAMVLLKRAADVTRQDLEAADGIILGSPTYFANIPGEMKTIMDQWNWKWKVDFTDKIGKEKYTVTIGITGKYYSVRDRYASILHALEHSGIALSTRVKIKWIETTDVTDKNVSAHLRDVDGIIVPGGFGTRGTEGKITCIRYARENSVPYLGLCLGFQMAVIEFARNVCGLKGANSTETDPG